MMHAGMSRIALALLALTGTGASAQQWPARPVRIIVPFPPGQAVDIVARMLSEKLSASLGQQVLVDNRDRKSTRLNSSH